MRRITEPIEAKTTIIRRYNKYIMKEKVRTFIIYIMLIYYYYTFMFNFYTFYTIFRF